MRFLYPRVGEGRVAIAYIELPGRTGEFWVSLAACSPKDQFVRARGRQLAAVRMGDPRHSRIVQVATPIAPGSLRRQLTAEALVALRDQLPRWAVTGVGGEIDWWYESRGQPVELGWCR